MYGLFEDQLFAYTRYKSVGAKAKGAVSSLELVRRLDTGTRRAYFEVAKECITSEFPRGYKRRKGTKRELRATTIGIVTWSFQ